MPRTTVNKTEFEDSNGSQRTQYRTTVPKGLAEAFDLAESKIEWTAESGNTLTITKVDE